VARDGDSDQGGDQAALSGASAIATGEVGITATNFVANGEVGISASNLVANGEVPGTNGLIVANSNGVASTATLGDIEAEPEVETFFNGQFAAPSLANGPGATGFTPNNSQLFLANGDVNPNFFAEYFDVTLRNAGTTFADIDVIEVDKLTIDNNAARLVINDTTDFTSIIDTQIASGTLEVLGIFTSRDILNGGLVTGTGTIFAETFFNVGMINAGEGFTINGDVILTSNGILAYSGNALNVNGNVSIDGGLLLGFDGAPTFGQSGTVLNYTGDRVGEFSSVSDLPGVLFAFVDYSQNGTVTFDIQAQDFAQFIGIDATPNQKAIAGFLDGNRGNFAALSDLFNSIDLLSGQALTTALDTLAPGNALNEISTGFSRNETLSAQVGRRIGVLGNGNSRGVAQFSANGDAFGGSSTLLTANALGSFVANAAGHASQVTLKEGWGMFGDVTYYTGDADTSLSGVNAELDGFSFTGGADYQFDNTAILGVYVNYGSGDMQHNGFLNTSDFTGVAAGLYGSVHIETVTMSAYVGYGSRDADLARTVVVGAQTQNITGKADSNELIGGAEVSARLARGDGKFVLRPSLRFDFANFDVDSYSEAGGSAALIIGKQDNKSSQISVGANLDIHLDQANGSLTPTIGGRFVHDFAAGGSNAVTASFVNAPGTSVTLLGAQRDEDWFEVEAGIDFNMSERVSAQLQVARTLDRKDIDYTSFSAKLSVRF
ncbi:MAG: autotransporter domain-containing protein, partial [Robiginitomaculum sp.]|nr:autotransporter domain-containing protein [Robiginitomaculum sp.]